MGQPGSGRWSMGPCRLSAYLAPSSTLVEVLMPANFAGCALTRPGESGIERGQFAAAAKRLDAIKAAKLLL